MRRLLIATGIVAVAFAVGVIGFGVWDSHRTVAVAATMPIIHDEAAAAPSSPTFVGTVASPADSHAQDDASFDIDPETQDNKTLVVRSGSGFHVVVEDGPPHGGLRKGAPLRPPWHLLTQSSPLGPCEAGETPGKQSTFGWDGSVTAKVHELVTLELESAALGAGPKRHLTLHIDLSPPVVNPDAGWGHGHSWLGDPRRPRIRQGQLAVSVDWMGSAVAHGLELGFPRFHGCYDDAVKRDPRIRGSIAMRFEINRDGTAEDASVVLGPGTTLPDARITSCIVHKIAYLSFMESDKDGVVVNYTLLLDPGSRGS